MKEERGKIESFLAEKGAEKIEEGERAKRICVRKKPTLEKQASKFLKDHPQTKKRLRNIEQRAKKKAKRRAHKLRQKIRGLK